MKLKPTIEKIKKMLITKISSNLMIERAYNLATNNKDVRLSEVKSNLNLIFNHIVMGIYR